MRCSNVLYLFLFDTDTPGRCWYNGGLTNRHGWSDGALRELLVKVVLRERETVKRRFVRFGSWMPFCLRCPIGHDS